MADMQGNLDLGVRFYPTSVTGNTSQMGYFVRYQSERNTGILRLNFGGVIDANFGTDRILDGFVVVGLEVIAADAKSLKPFVDVLGTVGAVNVVQGASSSVWVNYGLEVIAGMEIKFGTSENSKGIRISTGYRTLFGQPGGTLAPTDLTVYQLSLGFLF